MQRSASRSPRRRLAFAGDGALISGNVFLESGGFGISMATACGASVVVGGS